MIQDIAPHIYDNTYRPRAAQPGDSLLVCREASLLLQEEQGLVTVPTVADFMPCIPDLIERCQYLFQIDEQAFFLLDGTEVAEQGRWRYLGTQEYRELQPLHLVFACAVGQQLYRWYRDHRHCGRCGQPLEPHAKERALHCPSCGLMLYPTISPAVIVAVTDGHRILLSRSALGPYRRWALIAGYAEIGESLEQTVKREVLEEVGLRVKNLRYYKSQPWLFSDTLLVGYFCELEGSPEITLQVEELAEAAWFRREDMPARLNEISLTAEMMEMFRLDSPIA